VSAQIHYLIACKRESAIVAWFSIGQVLSEPAFSRFVSTFQLNGRWNCARASRQSACHFDVRDSP
jgi:hypothetical protein